MAKDVELPKDANSFFEFLQADPAVRRWYVARIFGNEDEGPYVDLYFALKSEKGRESVPSNIESIKSIPSDNPAWWEDENFDHPIHLPLSEFRRLLERIAPYSLGQPLEEGMVFLETWIDKDVQFVPFSYQARQVSRKLYRRLVGTEAVSSEGENLSGSGAEDDLSASEFLKE